MANVAKKYAKALFDTAKEKEMLDLMYEEFSTIDQAVQPELENLKELDTDPQQDVTQRNRFVAIIFGQANQYLQNMLMVLASNRHLAYIHEIFIAFETLFNQHYNQDFAVIESVYELSEDELTSIDSIIKSRTKLSKLKISNEVNPDLIGGIRVKVGTKVMDASIKNDLAKLEKQFIRVK
ncbi:MULTISPECIES: F0F1 ATP synthase subunit delta [Staphylococcus]|jgi:F-type H+-transporting ATPase subunit delta|uniref:ATP synthase subunit delta n=1 Tax=Staphylococcus nepalensis TaxID=214473 RepID=A0A291JJ73_9STAP|nr:MULTISPECIES: F0F1 ATP synthase subunit delta [Staphylococcus]VDG66561.1 ATP synthase F1 subunit delta [Lacrimispora indolis]ATH59605.1 F0F1 ATP synthase subunit delta [Staphylococcus nepalensis]ATH64696.1 F0F1 ATP synthase subunit delta [Staphylococcus nepalensis]AWI44053.1 F0F1 ATP synthase subunit delta [Staphylococcus nepalensis]MBO1206987.1 F0F1 ATP synthase subunit delta [Staphylococcus nepalensis]